MKGTCSGMRSAAISRMEDTTASASSDKAAVRYSRMPPPSFFSLRRVTTRKPKPRKHSTSHAPACSRSLGCQSGSGISRLLAVSRSTRYL